MDNAILVDFSGFPFATALVSRTLFFLRKNLKKSITSEILNLSSECTQVNPVDDARCKIAKMTCKYLV